MEPTSAQPADTRNPPVSTPLQALFTRLLNLHEVAIVLATLGLLVGLLGRFHFLADLATYFRLQAICALLYGGLVLCIFRRWRFGLTGLAVGVLTAATLAPFFLPRAAPVSVQAKPQFRFAAMNVLTRNQHKQHVVDYLRQISPDAFVLLEVDQLWSDAIREALIDEWPHQIHQPRGDNFGVLLCSKQAPLSSNVAFYGSDQLPTVEAIVQHGTGKPIRIIGTHPLPPMNTFNWNSRNSQFAAIAESVEQHELQRTSLVAGDLNCTPWSPFFRDLKTKTGLRDSSHGFGLAPTWYATRLLLTALPIDHVLLGADLHATHREVGPPLGSDHRAVIVDLVVSGSD